MLVFSACGGGGGGSEDAGLRVAPEGNKLAQTNVKLGVGYMQKGNNIYALKKFRKALELDSSSPEAHYAIAVLYDKLGKKDAAQDHFKESLSLNPTYSDAHNAYGAFLCREGNYKQADSHFLKALDNPLYLSPQTALVNAGICSTGAKKYDRAEAYFRKILSRNPKMSVALYQMAKLNYESGRYLPARAYIQRYAIVGKATSQTLWLGYRIEKELGDKGAIASYSLSLRKLFPDSEETYLLRGVK